MYWNRAANMVVCDSSFQFCSQLRRRLPWLWQAWYFEIQLIWARSPEHISLAPTSIQSSRDQQNCQFFWKIWERPGRVEDHEILRGTILIFLWFWTKNPQNIVLIQWWFRNRIPDTIWRTCFPNMQVGSGESSHSWADWSVLIYE